MMTLRTILCGAILSASGVLLLACGSGGSNTVVAGGGSAADSDAFITEFCQSVGSCCGTIHKTADQAKCEAVFQGLSAGLQYDAAKGQSCLANIRSRQGSTAFCSDITPDDACKGVYRDSSTTPGAGSKAPGEACTQDSDCASSPEGSVDCAYSSHSSAGQQTARFCQVRIANGRVGDGPCLATKDGNTESTTYTSVGGAGADGGAPADPSRGYVCDLANGAYCAEVGGTCTSVGKAGDACKGYASYECGKDAYCDYRAHQCAARVGAGGDCSSGSEVCAKGTRCDFDTKKCNALAPDGTACMSGSECASSVCINHACGSSSGGDADSLALVCGG